MRAALAAAAAALAAEGAAPQRDQQCTVLIYGATPAGIAAALSASRVSGNSTSRICLLEPTAYVGGMSSPGGIGLRDFAKETPCCTMAEWGALNAKHYGVTEPVWQPDNYVGEANFRALLADAAGVELFERHSLHAAAAVERQGARIVAVTTEDSNGDLTRWSAAQFIDASYEGDIARFAGLSITWGREPRSQYGEELAGVLPQAPSFEVPVNATWDNGSTIPFVSASVPPPLGAGDDGVMGWSYRPCVTSNTSNQAAFAKPAGYNPSDFELMKRYLSGIVAAGKKAPTFTQIFGILAYRSYPRKKHDLCDHGNFAVSSDAPDLQRGYINGTTVERARVVATIRNYVQGYLHWLSTDPSVPADTQKSVNEWGLCADEWAENDHFPPQLYIREGVRLVGDKVFTQNDWSKAASEEAVAVGSWGLDIHVVHRYANKEGIVQDEGYTSYSTGAHRFQLPYSLILPKRTEAENLGVAVCLSASHVTWAGLREEPTLWKLGMAAGTAAIMAGPGGVLRDLSLPKLQSALASQGIPLNVTASAV